MIEALNAPESSTPSRLQHGLDRAKQDHQIQPRAEVTQVVKVIGKLEIGILDAAGIGRTHLSPATEAWTHPVTLAVMRNAQLQLMLMLRPLRPRADQAHLTHKHIEQLRQFIQSQTAQDATDGRDALITNLRPLRRSVGRLH